MYDNFKTANYNNSLVSPEFYAKPLSRLFGGDVIDGLTVIPGTGLQVTLQPGNALLRYGSAAVASARIVSLVADFNLAIPTPDASNPRIDVVVIYVDNAVNLPVVNGANPPTSANLDGPGVSKAKIVSGTPAATPVAPTSVAIQASVGAGNSYTVLAQVRVDPGVALIAANKITDVRNMVQMPLDKMPMIGSDNIDFSTLEWTDTVTSVTGVTSLTTNTLSYLKLGPTVIISFSFMGTSNASTKTIQLPYEPKASIAYVPVHVRNNAVNDTGIVQISAASKTVQIFRNPAADGWTASGNCRATGQLIYTTDE
ncbi:hypothetical protein [Paeniglutamicibacter sp. NPDC091659]|uniref:hypothetical protein n=1 Tax=Paeniglutamicibacter sp. NPDC091659 TaxID=3364389 RepID=UPI0037FB2745